MAIKKAGKILIGCVVVVVIVAILIALFSGFIIKRLISGAIKEKTGVEVNVNDLEKGQLSYTDPNTGQTLNIGENTIPANFPNNFPIYPGSTVTSSLSGNEGEKNNGFWLTLTSDDSEEKVIAYYKENLDKNGWKSESSEGTGSGTNWAISKGNLSGYLTISTVNEKTSILIVLGDVNQ